MTDRHTPGPWLRYPRVGTHELQGFRNWIPVARDMDGEEPVAFVRREQDAALIADAPASLDELVSALREIAGWEHHQSCPAPPGRCSCPKGIAEAALADRAERER